MPDAILVAIVEVEEANRIRCQAEGCNHSVFRKIHVVHDDSGFHVYGSQCFKKLFKNLPISISSPSYTPSDGRLLTEEERQLLINNTEKLIRNIESEYQLDIQQRLKAKQKPNLSLEEQAKENVRIKYGVNPNLKGWSGFVILELKRLRKEIKEE